MGSALGIFGILSVEVHTLERKRTLRGLDYINGISTIGQMSWLCFMRGTRELSGAPWAATLNRYFFFFEEVAASITCPLQTSHHFFSSQPRLRHPRSYFFFYKIIYVRALSSSRKLGSLAEYYFALMQGFCQCSDRCDNVRAG